MIKEIKFFTESKVMLGAGLEEASDTGLIEAVFTTWGAREGADGRRFNYMPAPFQEWANGMTESDKPLPMFFQHNDEAFPVGEWTSFEFDDVGMTGKGRLFTNTSDGRDLYTIMKESPNLVGGVSVGAYADEYQMVDANGELCENPDEAFFQITKGGLREVSIVMNPNNPMSNINKLESCLLENGSIEPRNLEQALRDAGVSKQNAEVAVSVFKEVLEKRNAIQAQPENKPNRSDPDLAASNEAILAELNKRELLKQLNKRIKG
jgi:HK97 family phage prohead protease